MSQMTPSTQDRQKATVVGKSMALLFSMQRRYVHVTCGPLKELLQGFLTCKERDTLFFTRGIGFNDPNLTGRDCELDTSRTDKRTPHCGKR